MRLPAQRGLSYVEVLVATALIVVALVPAMDALRGGVIGAGIHRAAAVNEGLLRSRMEEVLAKPFDELYAKTYLTNGNSLTTPDVSLYDATNRVVVYLYRYDGAARTTTASSLLRIEVVSEVDGSSLVTLKGRSW